MKTCSVEGCEWPSVGLDRCRHHYWRERRERLKNTTCSVADCGRPQFCKTLCRGHYARKQRGAPIETPLLAHIDGNVTLTCRIGEKAMALLRNHAKAANTTPSKLAVQLLLRELGVQE